MKPFQFAGLGGGVPQLPWQVYLAAVPSTTMLYDFGIADRVLLSGSDITGYDDLSSNNFDATDAGATVRPVYSDPLATFTPANNDHVLLPTGVSPAAGAYTIGVKFNPNLPGAGTAGLLCSFFRNATNNQHNLLYTANAAGLGFTDITFGAGVNSGATQQTFGFNPPAALDGSTHRLVVTFDNVSTTMASSYGAFWDEVSQTVVNSYPTLAWGATFIAAVGVARNTTPGYFNPWSGALERIVIVPSVLTGASLTALHDYLAAASS